MSTHTPTRRERRMPAIDGANIVLAWPNEQVIRALDWLWMRIDNSDIQRQAP